jgi:microcystin-dependent protein
MSLESTTTIAGLVAANPTAGDPFSQGDDHLRLIKTVLKTIFPGAATGGFATPITATEAELNYVHGVTSAIQTQLNTITAALNDTVPIGIVVMWAGLTTAIPTGWALCDGTGGTPDLRGRFVLGYKSGTYAQFSTGGSADAAIVTHTHVATAASHTHTFTQITSASGGNGIIAAKANGEYAAVSASTGSATVTVTNAAPVGSVAVDDKNMPPYYVLAYIQFRGL